MGAVGVIRGIPLMSGGDDVRVALPVMLGKTVGGGLCRCGLQIVKVAVHLLVIGQTLSHVV